MTVTFYDVKNSCSKGLVTNYGEGSGATKREGGGMWSFTPMKRRGRNSFSHAEGGGGTQQVLRMFLCVSLKF